MNNTSPSVDEFRIQARAWMQANLEPRPVGSGEAVRGSDVKTLEGLVPDRALHRKIYEAGYVGIPIPEEYGGQGLTLAHEAAFEEEADDFLLPDLGICGPLTTYICANVILAHASEEVRLEHLPAMLACDEFWVELMSEPGAGSDLASITTRADRDGDNWILNGTKIWSSGAYYADYGVCLARTDWDVPKHRGLTWFIVPLHAEGVTVEPLREITGAIEFCEERLVDVVVPDSSRLGEVNQGWSVTQTVLFYEREGSSGGQLGARYAESPGALAPDLVQLAEANGRVDDRHTRQSIARAHVNDYAVRMLGARVFEQIENSADKAAAGALVAYPKLAVGTVEPVRARIAMELGAGSAIVWRGEEEPGYAAAMKLLNSRVISIAGGTNEMQRNGIGERVLGLPREPNLDKNRTFQEIMDRLEPER